MPRPAQIHAASLEVVCPYCGEPQPSPETGSHIWTVDEVRSKTGPHTCVSCDRQMTIGLSSKATVVL